MTVKDLKDLLNKIEDDSQEVEVSIGQANKRHPVAFCKIHNPLWDRLQNNGIVHRIEVMLPYDNDKMMITSTRKM
jgi:hypothetical protein